LEDLYPGDGYVDWACLDGYNFSSDLAGAPWRTFSQIFGATYAHLLKVIPAGMPILIGETGSVEHGGLKAAWITDALTVQIPKHFPRVKGLIWFNGTNPGIDLRIDTSPQALAALHQALGSGTFSGNVYRFLSQTPIPVPVSVASVASQPTLVHAADGPTLGTIQLVNAHDYSPVATARLVFDDGTSMTLDAHGSVTLPTTSSQTTLKQIVLSGGAIQASIPVDPRFGYQLSTDLGTGQVTQVLVHDPPSDPNASPIAQISLAPLEPRRAIELQATLTALLLVMVLYAMAVRVRSRRRRARATKVASMR
jgi:hypothetical protein